MAQKDIFNTPGYLIEKSMAVLKQIISRRLSRVGKFQRSVLLRFTQPFCTFCTY